MGSDSIKEVSKMKTYGVVLVGCGYMGAAHLEAIGRHKQARLVGVADVIEEKAVQFAERYGAGSWHTDYRQYLDREDVDIVIIATYPSTHLEIARACLASGKHILCEKPIAGSAREAEEFMRLAAGAKPKVLVGHILRHNATYQKVMEMIHGGAVGFPLVMRMSQVKRSHNWSSHLALLQDASPIVDCGVHYIDVMRWATGADVVSVSGIGQRLDQDVPKNTYNYGMITLKMTDGSVGYYEAGWGNALPNDNLKEFIGPKGRIRIIYKACRPAHERHLGNLIEFEDYRNGTRQEINVEFAEKPTAEQFDYFLSMIERNEAPKPALKDVYRAMQITLLADQAIHDGNTVMCL